MNRRVGLYKYIPINGNWRYYKAVFAGNNTLKAHAVLVGGVEIVCKNGYYCLYYAKRWEPVGNDPKETLRLLHLRRGELLTVASGGSVVSGRPPTVEIQSGKRTLREAVDDYVQELVDLARNKETVRAHRKCCLEFMDSCKVKYISEVTRQHCLQYVNAYLTDKLGNDDRTRYNKFGRLRAMLTREADATTYSTLKTFLTSKDAPDYDDEDAVALEANELEKFWLFCPLKKRLMYEVFLSCGLRMSELKTLRWVDIDFVKGLIRIQPRPEWNFKPKKQHCRTVPVGDELLEKLRFCRLTSRNPLLFPNRNGKPDTHLWEYTNKLFKKARLPIEKGHPHCFRATFCTTLFRQSWDLPSIMRVMGHNPKYPEVTMRYAVAMVDEDMRRKMNETKFNTMVVAA